MKTFDDILLEYNKSDVEFTNRMHRDLYEKFMHQRIMEDRKNKINKLKSKL